MIAKCLVGSVVVLLTWQALTTNWLTLVVLAVFGGCVVWGSTRPAVEPRESTQEAIERLERELGISDAGCGHAWRMTPFSLGGHQIKCGRCGEVALPPAGEGGGSRRNPGGYVPGR